jgi:hypothetical protein
MGIVSLVAGLLILIWPNLLVIVVGLTLIVFGIVSILQSTGRGGLL